MNKIGSILLSSLLIVLVVSVGLVGYYLVREARGGGEWFNANYVYDAENGLVWLKCDYGLAGKECNIPNYCGYDGTSQDSWSSKTENDPICNPERDYGKIIESKCDAILSGQRFVNTDESGVAVCENGVLCKDGSFIVVDWREDYKHYEEEYPIIDIITQKDFVPVPNNAKERACENHGGIETFGYDKIYDWFLPTTEELKTLYDPEFKGINSNKFPNASKKLMSSTMKIGSGTINSPDKRELLFFDKSVGGTIENCAISAPVKCVYRVEPINEDDSTSEENDFCSKAPKDIQIFCKDKLPKILSWEHFDDWFEENDGVYTLHKFKFYEDNFEIYFFHESSFYGLEDAHSQSKILLYYDKARLEQYQYYESFDQSAEKIKQSDVSPGDGLRVYRYWYPGMTDADIFGCEGGTVRYWTYIGTNWTDDEYRGYVLESNDEELSKKVNFGEIDCWITDELDNRCHNLEYCFIFPRRFDGLGISKIINVKENSFSKEELITIRNEFEANSADTTPATTSTENDCSKRCEELKKYCESRGMDYTYNGCVPICEGENCAYYRSCELNCYAN